LREWGEANPESPYDPDYFRRELLPKLSAVRVVDITTAAQCSKAYASDIRSGKYTPHVSTWSALGDLAGVSI
jgi:hypothetical protein